MNDGEQLAEFKSALAAYSNGEPNRRRRLTRRPGDRAGAGASPRSHPVMGAEGEKAFNDVLQASADDFWAGWPS